MSKIAGTLYESMFKVEAMKRGLHVSETVGDYLPYDCIVDNDKSLIKVQVKGTASMRSRTGFGITTGMGGVKQRYCANAFDVLAALCIGNGAAHWYIIPREKLGTNLTIKLYPNATSKGKWEIYRHSWDLVC